MEQVDAIAYDDALDNAASLIDRLVSLGYDAERVVRYSVAAAKLSMGASTLTRARSSVDEDIVINPPAIDSDDRPLPHDDCLLPWWKKFADALSSAAVCKEGYIDLFLYGIRLENEVTGMLIQSLRTAPIKALVLRDNGFGSEGMKFVANAVKTSQTLEHLCLIENPIESQHDASTLAKSVMNHRNIDNLRLSGCRIGQNGDVMSAILPVFESLEAVVLSGNDIGSNGATLISNCIARNPFIKCLNLGDNILDDDDAANFSWALRTNTNLELLELGGNRITETGVKWFWASLANSSSMDALYDSNHTCTVAGDGFPEGINSFMNPKFNRKAKVLCVMRGCYTVGMTDLIADINKLPIKLIPTMLAFLQRNIEPKTGLNATFQLVREWNMPLLYTLKETAEAPGVIM